MEFPDVVPPVVTSFAFFIGDFRKGHRGAGIAGPDLDDAACRTDHMVAAIRKLGVEKAFRRTCGEAAQWNWKAGGRRLPTRLPLKSELSARLEAIRALEVIAHEGGETLTPVMVALCTFVRQNTGIEDKAAAQPPRRDVQAALEAIGGLEQQGKMPGRRDRGVLRANLSLSMLTLVRLPEAWLAGADLTGSRLDQADLSGAVLSGAGLIAARLKGALLSEAEMSGADLLGAYLKGANLERANLEGANLSHTDVTLARLHGTRLVRANLEGWHCARASLRGADLTGAHNLERATLETCFGVSSGIGRTILPQGVEAPGHWPAASEPEGRADTVSALADYEARYRAWLDLPPDPA